MTFFRNIFKGFENILGPKRCAVLGKNSFNAENYFGSKIEIPSPPKRPLTAYMIFCKEKRKDLLKENPSLRSPEQIKMLAEKWSHLTADMKKPYEVSARQSTLAYGEEHKKFYENLTEEQKKELARLKHKRLENRRILRMKKEIRASGVPKHPSSAYIHFVQAEAKKHSFNQASEFIKTVAELWKNLPEDSKKIYENQAQEEKIAFAKEMNEWRAKMISEGKQKLLQAYDDLKGKGKLTDSEEAPGRKRKTTEKQAKEDTMSSEK